MNYHNHVKKLEKLKSLPFETLTEEQKIELNVLIKMKKELDAHEDMSKKIFRGSIEYYDRKGKPMSFWQWSGYGNDFEYKIVKQNTYGDFFVSTVWLGLDHDLPSNPECPIIFETMIFIEKDREHELQDYQERYCTEEEAIKGHIEACKLANTAASKDLCGNLDFFTKKMKKGEKS